MLKQVATSIASLLQDLGSPSRTHTTCRPGLELEIATDRCDLRPGHLKARADCSHKAALTADPPKITPKSSSPVEAERLSSRDNRLVMLA